MGDSGRDWYVTATGVFWIFRMFLCVCGWTKCSRTDVMMEKPEDECESDVKQH